MENQEIDYRPILDSCKQGKVTEELKKLYNFPIREKIPWILFPNWARPNDYTEGCHEGGKI
jgi:hypothetical protein